MHLIVIGLGFGDEGKGGIIDYLSRKLPSTLVVRFNGGGQAAHNVVTSEGLHHTFSQFGSGTFAGARTHLSRHMLVQPGALCAEGEHLRNLGLSDVFSRMTVDGDALVTTRFHMAVNRLREITRKTRHGSCGVGIGETIVDHLALGKDTLFVKDFINPATAWRKLEHLQAVNRAKVLDLVTDLLKSFTYTAWGSDASIRANEWSWLDNPKCIDAEAYAGQMLKDNVKIVDGSWLDGELDKEGTVLFEGAQGVLLDQHKGFLPYCTRSTTTFENARDLLGGRAAATMGVIRTYLTRHGAGPFPTEDASLTHPEAHNGQGLWQQNFRLGHFDRVLFRYALDAAGGVDQVAVTHVDREDRDFVKVCARYEGLKDLTVPKTEEEQRGLTALLEQAKPLYIKRPNIRSAISTIAQAPVTLSSWGPTADDHILHGCVV